MELRDVVGRWWADVVSIQAITSVLCCEAYLLVLHSFEDGSIANCGGRRHHASSGTRGRGELPPTGHACMSCDARMQESCYCATDCATD
eukprot:363938-Chlamydomonas_euryale.AAC.6